MNSMIVKNNNASIVMFQSIIAINAQKMDKLVIYAMIAFIFMKTNACKIVLLASTQTLFLKSVNNV